MTASTAVVKTLTAEVHVLQVGNRQITLSVARQLDAFEYEHDDEALSFTPFGRARLGTKGEKYVSCNSADKGAEWFPLPPERQCGGGCVRHPQRWQRKGDEHFLICGTHEKLALREYDYQWIGRHEPTGALIVVNAFDDDVRRNAAEIHHWTELPLIVLAGLR